MMGGGNKNSKVVALFEIIVTVEMRTPLFDSDLLPPPSKPNKMGQGYSGNNS